MWVESALYGPLHSNFAMPPLPPTVWESIFCKYDSLKNDAYAAFMAHLFSELSLAQLAHLHAVLSAKGFADYCQAKHPLDPNVIRAICWEVRRKNWQPAWAVPALDAALRWPQKLGLAITPRSHQNENKKTGGRYIETLRALVDTLSSDIVAGIDARLDAAGVPRCQAVYPTRATAYITCCTLHETSSIPDDLKPHVKEILRGDAPLIPINLCEQYLSECRESEKLHDVFSGGVNVRLLYRDIDVAKPIALLQAGAYQRFFRGVWPHLTPNQQRVLQDRLAAHAYTHDGPSTSYMNGYEPDTQTIQIVTRFLLNPTDSKDSAVRTQPQADATPYILAASLWLCAKESRYWYPALYDPNNWAYLA